MRELRDHLHRSLVRGGVEPMKAATLARGVLARAKAYLYAAGVLPQQMAAVVEDLDDTVAAATEARSRETLPPDEPCCDANARGHHCDCRPCGKCESEKDQPIPYSLSDGKPQWQYRLRAGDVYTNGCGEERTVVEVITNRDEIIAIGGTAGLSAVGLSPYVWDWENSTPPRRLCEEAS